MDTIQWVGVHNVQIVGQTATLPLSLEASAFTKLGITNYIVCHSKTACPNISYNVIHAFNKTQGARPSSTQSFTNKLCHCIHPGEAQMH